MNVFDIIGPVMIGPSSSHTAGAVRLGRVAHMLLGEDVQEAHIYLHGSFARTFKGHGTDRAILAGLMGMTPDDARIRDSMSIAHDRGMSFTFSEIVLKDSHPNTALIEAKGKSGKQVSVLGSSVGGGNITIRRIDGHDVEFSGQYNTMVISHKDAPGVVASVTNVLSFKKEVNIAYMKVYRTKRGGEAVMIIETDQQLEAGLKAAILNLPLVYGVTIIEPV